MSIELNKKTGISLKKGGRISLKKEGKKLKKVCIGLNWGAIERKMLFGLLKENENVDLDGSVTTFSESGEPLETVYYRNLKTKDKGIKHSGDDTTGDSGGDDGKDNEVIELDLDLISPKVHQIFFYLNSYKKQDFSDIPYSKIRIFEGTHIEVEEVMATFNLSSDETFKGYVAMIMGKLVREDDGWVFKAVGEPVKAGNIGETIKVIQSTYL